MPIRPTGDSSTNSMLTVSVRRLKQVDQLPDKTIIDEDGNFIFLGQEAFLEKVVRASQCFVCAKDIREHADEHVIPDWILRRCKLHDKLITLPNGTNFKYGAYKVPCCKSCNSFLGRHYEVPISEAFAKGPHAVADLANTKPALLFGWLNLLVFKTHLKDLSLRAERDLRVESGKIGDIYDWLSFHHMHAVVRAPMFGTRIDRNVIGSICLLNVREHELGDPFDYRDHYPSDTVFVRVGQTALISVLNDSGAVPGMLEDRIVLDDLPNLIQCAEILSEYQAANLHLNNRPQYRTQFDPARGVFEIKAELPSSKNIAEYNPRVRGEILWSNLQPFMNSRDQYGTKICDLKDDILAGRITFLPLLMD
jgi:hypothetical protein